MLDDPRPTVAHSTRWFTCSECNHLHVLLYDEKGALFAKAALSQEMLVEMLVMLAVSNNSMGGGPGDAPPRGGLN